MKQNRIGIKRDSGGGTSGESTGRQAHGAQLWSRHGPVPVLDGPPDSRAFRRRDTEYQRRINTNANTRRLGPGFRTQHAQEARTCSH